MQIPGSSSPQSQDSLLAVCLFAAFADGENSDAEREEIRRLAEEVGSENLAQLSRQILLKKLPLETAVAGLQSREDRLLAYEMALGVCEAGGSVTDEEKAFLAALQTQLEIADSDSAKIEETVGSAALASVPQEPTPAGAPDNDGMILKYAILNGALELLPETVATISIIPLQMNLVYRIGKSHGVELDREHLKEFLATAGLGLGSQVLEGFARKLMRGLGGKAGPRVGDAADQFTGSAFSFASTYALGQLAENYYAGGRRFDTSALQSLFASLQTQARDLHTKYLPEIQERAKSLTPASIFSLVRGSATP